ncbi:hypothetical protein [Streptomyces sp. NPDC001717]|uniref:hypothetical protein n=1 Tax=Streptomyces sp. NPDC001717 TaxID=3364604 RepID=UPI00367A2AB9
MTSGSDRSTVPGGLGRLGVGMGVLVLAVGALLGPGAEAGSGETISLVGGEPGVRLDVTLTREVDPAGPATAVPAAFRVDERLVAVRFRLENTGSAVHEDSPAACAHVLDSAGHRFAGTDTPTTAGAAFPTTVTLDPGGTAEGFVTFRVPQDAALVAVQYALDGGLADDVGQWSLA